MAEDRAKSFLQMINRSKRGKLKIYLGYGPGVGKTYLMLQEAHRLKKDGIEVVVGIVETHGRSETAKLLEGLEVIPRRVLEYHGITVDEMDLDAVLARNPQVVLVDELAHTIIPGSRNSKRYEDVQEILQAGIHVISSLNIQHLESLYNTVESLLGVKVRERIPDSVLADADDIVNVDLTTEDLQRRLQDGKIYPKERIAPALENFFKAGNLQHLRELTMREIASQIDFKRREIWDIDDKIAPDQVMVCLSSKGPNSARLLRFASRLAGRLNRNWYAVYVQTPSEEPTVIDAMTQRLLSETLTLANQLGATVFTFKGLDIAQTILNFAKEYRVGHIVTGRPQSIPEWKRRIFGHKSVAEQLLIQAKGITLVIADAAGDGLVPLAEDTSGAASRQTPAVRSNQQYALSEILKPEHVLIVERLLSKEEIIHQLLQILAKTQTGIDPGQVETLIMQRENQGSTFLNEGLATPHALLENLPAPIVAVALTKAGVTDSGQKRLIEVVVLIVEPNSAPRGQLLGEVIRVFRPLHAHRELMAVHSPEELLALVKRSSSQG